MGEIIFKTNLIKGAKGDAGAPNDLVANEYNSTVEYSAGDFCIHEDAFYKCTATTTGLWDSSKWVLTSASDETKTNAAAIEAINENGCCNILPNNSSGGTSHNVSFTVNSDNSVSFSVDSTPDGDAVLLVANHLYFEKDIRISGLPSIDGCVAYLYDNTASQQIWIETNNQKVTINPSHDYGFVLCVKSRVTSGTTGTYYPMIYDARLNPTGYVSYSMTNRELTERFAVITGNTASDAGTTTFSYPQGFTKDNTFIVTLAIYISSYWYQYNNTTTFYAATATGSINVVAEDAAVRGKPIKLLLMRV